MCLRGKEEDLVRWGTVAQEVIEEEVVQLVGADGGLGELRDLTLGVGGEQLRRDGRVEDGEERLAERGRPGSSISRASPSRGGIR